MADPFPSTSTTLRYRIDGRHIRNPVLFVDEHHALRSSRADGNIAGRIGTVTATLCSSEARPCIDVQVIPAKTSDMGVLVRAQGLPAAASLLVCAFCQTTDPQVLRMSAPSDVIFREDARRWVMPNPRLTATIMLLRRIGYSLLLPPCKDA